jgi:hypothetical protein
MFDETHKLDVTKKDLEVIEAALQTQFKILGFEANAGGAAALERLNDVKRALAKIDQHTLVEKAPAPKTGLRLGMGRIFG